MLSTLLVTGLRQLQTSEGRAAVTALGCGNLLLLVQVVHVASRRLDTKHALNHKGIEAELEGTMPANIIIMRSM